MKKPKKRSRGGASVLCPSCGAPSKVLTTRRPDDDVIVRRRQCGRHAGHRFETRERVA